MSKIPGKLERLANLKAELTRVEHLASAGLMTSDEISQLIDALKAIRGRS